MLVVMLPLNNAGARQVGNSNDNHFSVNVDLHALLSC